MAQNSIWTINICKIKKIPIRIHITFFLFLVWVAFEESVAGGTPIIEVLFVITLFGCVLLHELGHALTAKHFGVRTRDIILYPFGGIAALLEEPKPKAELFITAAGPLVNVVIALMLLPWAPSSTEIIDYHSISFAGRIFFANVMLAIFNLIPAFPMDGGRILRAALMLWRFPNATRIAARLSQGLSLALAAFALYIGNPILVFVATIVFVHAMQEYMRDRARNTAMGFRVRDAMADAQHLQVLQHGMTISQAADVALKSVQTNFPVMLGNAVIGLIDRQTLLQATATEPEEAYLSSIMSRDFSSVAPDESLSSISEKLATSPFEALMVLDDGRLAGMLLKEKLLEFLIVRGLRDRARRTARLMDEEF